MKTPTPLSNAANAVLQLVIRKNKAKENAVGWVQEGKRCDAELAEIIKPEEHLKAAGKMANGGSTTIEEYGAKFTVEAEKSVVWDSAKLQSIAAGMAWPMVEAIFKIKFEISETKYKDLVANAKAGMFDPKILEKINEARTVKIGEPKIKTAEIIE